MKGAGASTARGVALVRALEMERPEADRITSDPYAARFADPLLLKATKLSIATGLSRLMGIEGMINFALLRERYIGEMMQREIAEGATQLVVLGAGFDTRAYRLGTQEVAVFEVDHPATQADKRRTLASVVAPFPANVHFVPVDFERDRLDDRLEAAGYDATQRTVFVWQGVVPYLTRQGVDATLAVIGKNADPQTLVVFDFGYASRAGDAGMPAMLNLITRLMGEPAGLGIGRGEVGTFLASRGFGDIVTIEGEALRALYVRADRNLTVARDVAIVSARVGG